MQNLKHLFLLSLTTTLALCLFEELDTLHQTKYSFLVQSEINLTITENTKIDLPEIDSEWGDLTIQSYQMGSNQYGSFVEIKNKQRQSFDLPSISENFNPDGKDGNSNPFQRVQDNQKRFSTEFDGKIPLSKEDQPLICSLQNPSIEITKTYTSLRSSDSYISNWMQIGFSKIYKHVPFRSLFYSLNPQTMALQAFHYNEHSLSLLSSFNLPQETIISGKISMATNANSSSLYVFTEKRIYFVDVHTILTRIKEIDDIGGFTPKGLDKVLVLGTDRFIGLRKMEGVYIFKENVRFKGDSPVENPSSLDVTTKFKDIDMNPQDIHVEISTVYILDLKNGIFIFSISPNGKLIPESQIEFATSGNFQMKIKQSTILVLFNDEDGSKMVQIYHNKQKQRGQLVRYYKSNNFIEKIDVFQAETSLNSNLESRQSFIFLIVDEDYLQIYPYNIDPRMVRSLDNGVKIQISRIRDIFQIFRQRYVVVTDDQILYIKMVINKPKLFCKVNRGNTGTFRVQVQSNLSSCEQYTPDFFHPHKKSFNSFCTLSENYIFTITDPQLSEFQKLIGYGVVTMFVVLFLAGLMCLIQWRNNKLLVLQRLRDQIGKFRNRAKRMQPFVQEEERSDQVEVQVPKIQSLREQVQADNQDQVVVDLPDLNDSN